MKHKNMKEKTEKYNYVKIKNDNEMTKVIKESIS